MRPFEAKPQRKAHQWRDAVAALKLRPWFSHIDTSDLRFRWFRREVEPLANSSDRRLWRFLHALTGQDQRIAQFGELRFAELLRRLADYGDDLATLSLEAELASILSIAIGPEDFLPTLQAFGWNEIDASASGTTLDRPDSPRAAELRAAAKTALTQVETVLWTPALDRALGHAASLTLFGEIGRRLHSAGITEGIGIGAAELSSAADLCRKTLPSNLRTAIERPDPTTDPTPETTPAHASDADSALVSLLDALDASGVNDDAGVADDRDKTAPQDALNHVRVAATPAHQRASTSPAEFVRALPVTDEQLIGALRRIAAWAAGEHGASTLLDAITLAQREANGPPEIARAWATLSSLDLPAFGGTFAHDYDPAIVLGRVLDALPGRDRRIFVQRVLAMGRPTTLAELGTELGVSRERIRQIERQAEKRVRNALGRTSNGLIDRAARRLYDANGEAFPISALEPDHPGVDAAVLSGDWDGMELLQALLWRAGPYRLADDGWLLRQQEPTIERRTISALDEALAVGPLLLDDATQLVGEPGIRPDVALDWIGRGGHYRLVDGEVLSWTGGFADKAVQILRMVGIPMTRNDLAARVGEPTAMGTIRNALNEDNRFARVSRHEVGLRDWGLDEYTTIEEEIALEIERQGGEASVAHLIDALTTRFGVAEGSVRAYIGAGAHFRRNANGNVEIGERTLSPVQSRPIELARNCYFIHGTWAARLVVSPEVLRGFSPAIPSAFGGHLNVRVPGEARVFATPFGPFRIVRNTTTTNISSVRRVAGSLDLRVGDLLFIVPDGSGALSFRTVAKAEIDAAHGLHRLSLLVGAGHPTDAGGGLGAIAVAIGLDPEGSVADIRARLNRRSEDDLAALLPDDGDRSQP